MTGVEVFQFPSTGQALRGLNVDGEPWAVLADACQILALSNPSMAASRLDADDLSRAEVIDGMGRKQSALIVSEAGLYMLIMRSDKPQAVAFQRWLAKEVIPAIRKTGRYEMARLGDPLDELELANNRVSQAVQIARQERAGRLVAETRALELAPRAEAWDVLASAHGDYSVREAAYMLNRDPSIDTGMKRLFKLLRDWRLIDAKDIPYATHARHVCLRARSYPHPHTGEQVTTDQVRVTADGLRYLHKRMGGTEPLSIPPTTDIEKRSA